MHSPGQPTGSPITATGVTPDIVLEIFFILCFPYTCRDEVITSLHTGTDIKESTKSTTMPTNKEVFDEIAESWYRFRHWSRFTTELSEMAFRWHEGKLLNVGCAHGPDFLPFKDNFELWGVDFSTQMVRLAQKYAAKLKFNTHLAVADALSLPYPNNTGFFNITIPFYIIEQ